MIRAVVRETRAHSRRHGYHDDFTIVILKRRLSPQPCRVMVFLARRLKPYKGCNSPVYYCLGVDENIDPRDCLRLPAPAVVISGRKNMDQLVR